MVEGTCTDLATLRERQRRSPFAEMDSVRLEELLTFEVLYHAARERFFVNSNRLCSLIIFAAGFASITALFSQPSAYFSLITAAIAILSVFQFVLDLGNRGLEHKEFRHDYMSVLAKLQKFRRRGNPECDWIPKLEQQMEDISKRSPPAMHIVEAIAYNKTKQQLYTDCDSAELIYVSTWHKLMRNFMSGDHLHLKTYARRDAEQRRNDMQRRDQGK